ncbi:MAG: DUF1887 family protein [Oscillospiraceae bacterium]|nr:DUF1887 family protein [Oscillospiraceae bacterium]
MTLIECFTKAHIDNIAACLRLRPQKLIFVGNTQEMTDPVERYKALFRRRGLDTAVALCNADEKDFGDLRAVLFRLISASEECVIDLTGGEPSVAMALGAALADLGEEKRKTVRVERYDHQTDTVVDYIHDNRQEPAKAIHLTVEEMIALHGGGLFPDAYQLPADCTRKDLDRLWRVVAGMPKQWNEAVSLLKRFEKYSETKNPVRVSLQDLWESIPALQEKEETVRELIEKLDKEGVVTDQSSRNTLQYSYNSDFLRYCIHTQGNVLELKTLLEGRAVREAGAPLFGDSRMGVKIDWDGDIPTSGFAFSGTRNEIDVLLMRGATPLFVSCKNGDVKPEELYKLHTVAARFGGPYARKMLVVADLDRKDDAAAEAFARRAWDMDIFLVADAAELSADQWQEIFRMPFGNDPEKAMEEFLKALQ